MVDNSDTCARNLCGVHQARNRFIYFG